MITTLRNSAEMTTSRQTPHESNHNYNVSDQRVTGKGKGIGVFASSQHSADCPRSRLSSSALQAAYADNRRTTKQHTQRTGDYDVTTRLPHEISSDSFLSHRPEPAECLIVSWQPRCLDHQPIVFISAYLQHNPSFFFV